MTTRILKIALVLAGLLYVLSSNVKAEENRASKQVPSSTEEVTVVVPQTFTGNDLIVWEAIDNALRNTPFSIINLEIQGFGGDVFEMNKFIQSVKYAQARGKIINMIVVGPSYSAHAFITCYANKVVLKPEGALMFHQMKQEQSFLFIRYGTVVTDAAALSLQDAVLDKCVASSRLNKSDVLAILNDSEVTITQKNGEIIKSYFSNSAGPLFVLEQVAKLIATIALGLVLIGLYRRA